VVATEAAYRPFEFKDEAGTIVGFDVDLMRAVAREAGLEAAFVDQAFDGLIPGLNQGKFDAAISCMTITEERARVVDFSDPYYDAGQVIAVRAADASVRDLADLEGRTIAVQRSTTGHALAEKVKGATVKAFDAVDPAFLEVLAGRADAVINDEPTTLTYLAGNPGLRVASRPLTEERYGIAVKKGNADLLRKINDGLARVRASGEYDRIKAEWIGGAGPDPLAVDRERQALTGRDFLSLLGGLGVSLLLGVCALLVSLVAGLAVALARLSRRPWLRLPATLWVEVIRGIPLLVLLLWIYFGILSDVLGAIGIPLQGFPAAVLAFGICYSAFVGETYRAGIQSVDPGQTEAARALGLSRPRAMRWVVLPQAIRNILPALGNEAIALVKDTSLASVIALPELMQIGKNVAGRTYRSMETYTVVAFLYLGTTLLLTLAQRRLERRFGAAHLDPARH
jgi:His/Glu/Gln/Arg/opine family amino acid ABC transporter permease subunit